MEPRIQYAKTEDGVSIAYTTVGDGPALVIMPSAPFSHLELAWETPAGRQWIERLAEKRKVVLYDGRGSGLSEREIKDYTADALVLDLEAVADSLHLERFALLGQYISGLAAIPYAVRHPDCVSHLILWSALIRYADVSAQFLTLIQMADQDWELYTEMRAYAALGLSDLELARTSAAFMRESTTPQVVLAMREGMASADMTPLLSQVRAPTLVLHRRQVRTPEFSVARRLASQIPDAHLVVLEGSAQVISFGDSDSVVRAIDEFLSEGEEEAVGAPAPTGMVTILFTDMEGSTALAQRLGDAAAQEVRRAHNEIVRSALTSNGGGEIKHTGDGIMASFATASAALKCAVAIQRGVAAHVAEQPDSPLGVYIGLNAGEPIAEDDDLFGTSVDLARRICDHAEPGQILASNVVRELAEGKGFLFGDIGDVVPKGFEQPVRLYEVRWRDED